MRLRKLNLQQGLEERESGTVQRVMRSVLAGCCAVDLDACQLANITWDRGRSSVIGHSAHTPSQIANLPSRRL